MTATRNEVERAERELAARDPVLASLIRQAGPCTLGRRGPGTHFEHLARAICYQQLAGRAAAAIWRRVRGLVPGRFTPEAVLALGPPPLRTAGLSGAKTAAVLDLAAKVAGEELRLGRIGALSDAAVVDALVQVRGVGRWTAEMFLMFRLGRLDVWPVGDLGVRNGWALAYGLPAPPPPAQLEALGERHRPWRSVAAWYCWRAVDARVPG